MDNKKKFLDDNKNVAILVLSIILGVVILFFILFIMLSQIKKSEMIDTSNYSYSELVAMFNQEGYEITIHTSGQYTVYIVLENNEEGVTIQRIYNNLIGNLMTFDDDSINDEMADLIDTSENDTPEKQQQYKAFENWLNKYNLTKYKISNMLDTYYDLHKDEAEDLDALIYNALNT